jgi:hypothetical protein
MRVPAKQALQDASVSMAVTLGMVSVHGDVVSVELLFVAERFEVGFDRERDDCGRVVGQVLLEGLRVYRSRHFGCVGVFCCDWEIGVYMRRRGWRWSSRASAG